MPRPFLEIFPREIRDQIYTFILTSPSGSVGLSPWSVAVGRSLSVLRTCKQIHREVKDIIWTHHGLGLRLDTQISRKFALVTRGHGRGLRHVDIDLEIMDRDELRWILHGLKILADWNHIGTLKSITLRTIWERPRDVGEYKEVLMLRKYGETLDGRLYQDVRSRHSLHINTGWPRFSHWGKQKWLKEMLLDPSGIDELLKEIHDIFGGELHVDKVLCFKGKLQIAPCELNPRDGELRIVPESVIRRHGHVERSLRRTKR